MCMRSHCIYDALTTDDLQAPSFTRNESMRSKAEAMCLLQLQYPGSVFFKKKNRIRFRNISIMYGYE